jgi:hypothetical protein
MMGLFLAIAQKCESCEGFLWSADIVPNSSCNPQQLNQKLEKPAELPAHSTCETSHNAQSIMIVNLLQECHENWVSVGFLS